MVTILQLQQRTSQKNNQIMTREFILFLFFPFSKGIQACRQTDSMRGNGKGKRITKGLHIDNGQLAKGFSDCTLD